MKTLSKSLNTQNKHKENGKCLKIKFIIEDRMILHRASLFKGPQFQMSFIKAHTMNKCVKAFINKKQIK